MGKLERTPDEALDDIVAMLQIAQPEWVGWHDPRALHAKVAAIIAEGVPLAREHGRYETACIRIEHDPDAGETKVLIVASYQFDEPEDPS